MQTSSRPTERSEGEPGPIGRTIMWHGPVEEVVPVIAAVKARNPSVQLNGSRIASAALRLPG